ncbi:hypothetical protein HNQ50_003801 [Silvimonas terrae]|uniref:Uncharacterized protein n=1 Tax=Silvimonas terrae TaxID=300266 RepID=A0A840RIV9_9NEIS|nr:hypothetical protein [Silvimonas terrae]MBB5193047.1 hypothetical protein [Silvimonas terrae]
MGIQVVSRSLHYGRAHPATHAPHKKKAPVRGFVKLPLRRLFSISSVFLLVCGTTPCGVLQSATKTWPSSMVVDTATNAATIRLTHPDFMTGFSCR